MKIRSLRDSFLFVLRLTAAIALVSEACEAQTSPQPGEMTIEAIRQLATPTGKSENKAPQWAKAGTYVYRMSTPDTPNVLPILAEDIGITSNLLDRSIQQVPIINGLIGHDHLGGWNWDGAWPYWDRVTFRAGSWANLAEFMQNVKLKYNTKVTFHVNLTDVNVGLKDYPETRAFYQRLVETKSIYRRDLNPVTNERDGKPYVPEKIPEDKKDPVEIYAIVDYKNYWDSGLAKDIIDGLYSHLPYSPPILYLDVLSTTGNNLNVGFPDGPLGGSEATQIEGIHKIGAYLRSKGTDIAIESDRPFVSPWATYSWRSTPGISTDDYSMISGGSRELPWQQVAGATGDFNVSPIASTPAMLARVREHYANLLAGKKDEKKMPGLETWHIANRAGIDDQYDFDRGKKEDPYDMIPSFGGRPADGGDPFRGDLADLVNNFYLTGIQDLYFIGKGAVRTAIFNQDEKFHLKQIILTDPDNKKLILRYSDFVSPKVGPDWIKMLADQGGYLTMATPFNARSKWHGLFLGAYSPATSLSAHLLVSTPGKYRVQVVGGGAGGAMNIYANGELQRTLSNMASRMPSDTEQSYDAGEIAIKSGDNVITLDSGPLYAEWSDGTKAIWTTPGIYKGLKISNGDVIFADDYDRMWPDTWSGQKKVYFFSWDGTGRTWKLPPEWRAVNRATLYPLTPDGRGKGIPITIRDRTLSPKLLAQIPYVLVPEGP